MSEARSQIQDSGSVAEPIQIVMHDALVPAFKDWLATRHLHLAGPIPTGDDDMPFYIIGINDDHPVMRDA